MQRPVSYCGRVPIALQSGLLVETRSSIVDPNPNDPVTHPPATVGPPTASPGDPDGVEIIGPPLRSAAALPPIHAAPWSGWPAEWSTPSWFGKVAALTDTAWTCLDSNASILATMPPYLVGAATSLNADWLVNPSPDVYTGWVEFAKQMFWNYQAFGEVVVYATARYSTGWPARFHVLPPWAVEIDLDGSGRRRYTVGGQDVTDDVLHVRYVSSVGSAHGQGPLEVAGPRLVAAGVLARYATTLVASGGIPSAVIKAPHRLTAERAAELQEQWVAARMSSLGLPAVLSGGLEFETLTLNPTDLAYVDLAQWNEARIATLLLVPPFCVGLPSGGDSMTYSNVQQVFDYRWRAGLKPLAASVMDAFSYWALPRGTTLELNRDEFVRPGLLERAQTYDVLVPLGILTVDEVREIERFGLAAPTETLTSGVLQ